MNQKTECLPEKIAGVGIWEWVNFTITFSLISACFLLMVLWFRVAPSQKIEIRLGVEGNEILKALASNKVNIKGNFKKFSGSPSLSRGTWGGFRGAEHDNIYHENVALLDSFGGDKVKVQWSVKLGEGYAGAAVANGCVYVLDHDKANQNDNLRCLSFDDGSEIWNRFYRVKIKRNHGISRTVPAVSDKYVVTMGPKCQVLCADALTGDFKWGIDLPVEYETRVPLWYTGQCPLIDGSTAIIAPGGKSLLIAIDCETGGVVWETPNPDGLKMSHSSIIPMTFYGKKMYVYCAIGAMFAVSADGDDMGRILLKTTEWNHSVISPSPVKLSGERIFVTAGYGNGSKVFQVKKNGADFTIEPLHDWSKEKFACEQHTPLFYKDHLFGILPNDAGGLNRQLVCMTPDGTQTWSSGNEDRFGLGPFIIADDKLFVLNDDGVLTIIRADPGAYKKLDQVKVLEGIEAWAPIAIADGRMLLRDLEELKCLDIRKL